MIVCKVCDSDSSFFAQATILHKYEVAYYRCGGCGFVQTEEPYWLDEAYSNAIIASDVGILRRNLAFAEITERLIAAFFDHQGPFIDYGGGYGLFVRLMRDRGYDFYRDDPYCENLLARGFDRVHDQPACFELLTAFEVFEHLPDPLSVIRKMRSLSGNLLFSTQLITADPPQPTAWWYYVLDGGQHVSLYTKKSLQRIAEQLGLRLITDGKSLHLLTAERLTPILVQLVMKKRLTRFFIPGRRRESLTQRDYETITGRKIA